MNHDQPATISPTILGAHTVRITGARRPLLIYLSPTPGQSTLPTGGMRASDSRMSGAASWARTHRLIDLAEHQRRGPTATMVAAAQPQTHDDAHDAGR